MTDMHRACFQDNLAFAADLFAVDDAQSDPGLVPASALFDAERLAPWLSRYGLASDATDRRAIASQWSKFAFARLIIPTVVLQCSLNRALDFSGLDWHVRIDSDGTPAAFVFRRIPLTGPGHGRNISSLVDDVMIPMITALRRGFGLAPRVYGSNAAMYFTWALTQLEQQARGLADVRAALLALNTTPARPDGGFNPFHAPYKSLSPGARNSNGEPVRECRRLCCVRDLDPVWDLCSNCPRAIIRPVSAIVGD